MQKPSRNMPAAPAKKAPVWSWLLLGGIFTVLLITLPFATAGLIVAGWILGKIGLWQEERKRKRLATSRTGESICTFARSFDWRHTDTWILRAVYEEMDHHCGTPTVRVPIRRTDDLEKDLCLDSLDIDEIAYDIAFRARRSVDRAKENPMFSKIHTVGDLVKFMEWQPKLAR